MRWKMSMVVVGVLSLFVSPAMAQTPVDEVLCPLFTPEATVKYCITVMGNDCVRIIITTFNVPGNPEVNQKVCPLP